MLWVNIWANSYLWVDTAETCSHSHIRQIARCCEYIHKSTNHQGIHSWHTACTLHLGYKAHVRYSVCQVSKLSVQSAGATATEVLTSIWDFDILVMHIKCSILLVYHSFFAEFDVGDRGKPPAECVAESCGSTDDPSSFFGVEFFCAFFIVGPVRTETQSICDYWLVCGILCIWINLPGASLLSNLIALILLSLMCSIQYDMVQYFWSALLQRARHCLPDRLVISVGSPPINLQPVVSVTDSSTSMIFLSQISLKTEIYEWFLPHKAMQHVLQSCQKQSWGSM